MSDHHFQLPSTELDPIFTFARDTWTNSFERFTGDVEAFNRNNDNDIFIIKHTLAQSFNGHTQDQTTPYFVYLWKPGVAKKIRKDLESKITIPIHQITMLSTPAMAEYPYHHEGMEHTVHSTELFRKEVRQTRRSVNLNYPVSNADLSKSRIQWAEPTAKLEKLLVEGYQKIMTNTHQRTDQAYIQSHIKYYPEIQKPDPAVTDILYAMQDSGEGVRIKSHQAMVYEDDPTALAELLTPVDEYYGMPVPTLIRTSQWHRVDNTQNPEQRTMGVISFPPEYSYFDVKKLIMDNQFIK
jgi:hypothetical protein